MTEKFALALLTGLAVIIIFVAVTIVWGPTNENSKEPEIIKVQSE